MDTERIYNFQVKYVSTISELIKTLAPITSDETLTHRSKSFRFQQASF